LSDINGSELQPRVLIDWDGDNFLNAGVPQGAPLNVMPGALFTSDAEVWSYAPSAPLVRQYIIQAGEGVRGWGRTLIYSSPSYLYKYLLFRGFDRHQQHPEDTPNLTPESMYADYTGWGMLGVEGKRPVRREVINDTGLQGLAMLTGIEPRNGASRYAGTVLGLSATHADGTPDKYGGVGYIDGGQRYSRSILSDGNVLSSAITWTGFPDVTPGTTYTLVCQVMVLDKVNPGVALQVRPRLYGDGGSASSPNYGRVDLGGTDTTLTQSRWSTIRIVFTPAVGTTKIHLDFQLVASSTYEINIAGLMLLEGTVTPNRYWSSQRKFTQEQFPVVLPGDNEPYVLSYWVRRTSAAAVDITPTTHTIDISTGDETSATAGSLVTLITDEWVRVDTDIPASTDQRAIYQTWATSSSTFSSFEVEGFMLVKGTTRYDYYAGEAAGYEDITQYVMGVTTQSGRDAFMDTLPAEGTAEIMLRNDGRLFSPKNTASIYTQWMKPNRKVIVQVKDPRTGEWVTLWAGWTHTYGVTPGTNGDNQAVISARQGLFRLAEGVPPVTITTDTSLAEVIPALVQNSGWVTAKDAIQSQVGLSAQASYNAFTTDVDQFFNRVDEGLTTLELVGKDWGRGDDPRSVIDELLSSENAAMWVDRDGGLVLVNREYCVKEDPVNTIVLGSDTQSADYQYGQDIINQVEVKLNTNRLESGAVVWEHRRPVRIGKNRTWVVEMNPEYTEGNRRSVIQYTLDGLVKDVYIKDPGLTNDTAGLSATPEDQEKILVELLQNNTQRPRLRITNNTAFTMWVSLKVKGDYLKTGDTETVTFTDEDSIEENGAVYTHSFSSSLISDAEAAQRYAEYVLQRSAVIEGEYKSVSLVVSDTTLLEKVLDTKIGSVLELGDVQTGETALGHVVLGESFQFITNRHLQVEYTLARTFAERFYRASVSSVSEPGVNLIPATDAVTTFGGKFGYINWREGSLERVAYWDTGAGHGNTLVLSPDKDMVLSTNFFDGGDSYPKDSVVPIPYHRNVYEDRSTVFPAVAGWFVPPTRYSYVFQVHNQGLSGVTQEVWWKMRRDRVTDISASQPIYTPLLAVCEGEKYRAYCSYYWPNVTGDGRTMDGGYDYSSARLLYPYVKQVGSTGGVAVAARWENTAAALSVNAKESSDFMVGSSVDFRAMPSGTGYNPDGLLGSGKPVGAVGFQLLKTPIPAAWGNPVALNLVRHSGYGLYAGHYLSSADAHKYTVFLKLQPGYADEDFTLTVTGEDGAVIGTQTETITGAAVTKLEITLPAGTVSAWGAVKKATQNYINTRVLIYGWGISYNSVTDPADLLVTYTTERIHA
jgi:hypothetical protein